MLWSVGRFGWDGGGLGGTVVGWVGWWWVGWDGGGLGGMVVGWVGRWWVGKVWWDGGGLEELGGMVVRWQCWMLNEVLSRTTVGLKD